MQSALILIFMSGNLSQIDVGNEPEWEDFERLLSEFANLAKSDTPFHQVAEQLIAVIRDALAPTGAAVWTSLGRDSMQLECQFGLHDLSPPFADAEHRQLMMRMASFARPVRLPPFHQGVVSNPFDGHLLAVPLLIDDDVGGLIELVQRSGIGGETLEGNQRLVNILAELAADNLRRHELRQLRASRHKARQFDNFVAAVHRSLDPRITAVTIANASRPLIGCDRVTVAIRRGRKFRLAAVSAVDVIHRRSRQVRLMEKLLKATGATKLVQSFEAGDNNTAPQIDRLLNAYFDDAHSNSLGIVPLVDCPDAESKDSGTIIGALVIENFDARSWDEIRPMAVDVARHASSALASALTHRSLPALPFSRRRRATGESTHRLAKSVAALAVIGAITSTFFIRTDFHVQAEGVLQPTVRQSVFAPLDGQVARIAITHGAKVNKGQLLIEMTSPELDLEIQKIQGEHEATLQRLRSIDSIMLLPGTTTRRDEDVQARQLAAEKQELQLLSENQQQRLIVLHDERKRLMVNSPIDGVILTWETDQLLKNRPVRRGQRLLTVADVGGDWEADMSVRDDEFGPLLTLVNSGVAPTAELELATERGTTFRGRVERLAGRTEIDATNRPVVKVVISVDDNTALDPRPGATVSARLNCGQRSLFYVWCHKIVDRVVGFFRF